MSEPNTRTRWYRRPLPLALVVVLATLWGALVGVVADKAYGSPPRDEAPTAQRMVHRFERGELGRTRSVHLNRETRRTIKVAYRKWVDRTRDKTDATIASDKVRAGGWLDDFIDAVSCNATATDSDNWHDWACVGHATAERVEPYIADATVVVFACGGGALIAGGPAGWVMLGRGVAGCAWSTYIGRMTRDNI